MRNVGTNFWKVSVTLSNIIYINCCKYSMKILSPYGYSFISYTNTQNRQNTFLSKTIRRNYSGFLAYFFVSFPMDKKITVNFLLLTNSKVPTFYTKISAPGNHSCRLSFAKKFVNTTTKKPTHTHIINSAEPNNQ